MEREVIPPAMAAWELLAESGALRSRAEGSAFAVDHNSVRLPVEVVLREVGEFGHAKSGVKKGPRNQLLFVRRAERTQGDSTRPHGTTNTSSGRRDWRVVPKSEQYDRIVPKQ
jgi:hypothetical protein